jgi:hypothetical protein
MLEPRSLKANLLPVESLCNTCDPSRFRFRTTAEIEPLQEFPGQERAVRALQFGLTIRHEGYNLFALGPMGVGKLSLVRHFTQAQAELEQVARRLVLPPAVRWVLLQPRRVPFRHPMVVLHPQAHNPEALLEAARAFMEDPSQPLTVVILGENGLTSAVQAWQVRQGALIRPVHLPEARLEALLQVFSRTGCDGLVVGADLPLLAEEGLARLPMPLLVVR